MRGGLRGAVEDDLFSKDQREGIAASEEVLHFLVDAANRTLDGSYSDTSLTDLRIHDQHHNFSRQLAA
jgi:hypothetical protein